MRLGLLTGLVVACSFEPDAVRPPVERPDGTPFADAAADAAAADAAPLGPFGPPMPIGELNTPDFNEDDPSLTADLREIYFGSDREGGAGAEDIWFATRTDPDGLWDPPQPVTELNTDAIERTMKVAPDGLTLFFASNRPGGDGGDDLYVSRRDARGLPWGDPQRIVELASADGDWAAYPSADLMTLVFCSSRSGNEELYLTTRPAPEGPWTTPPVHLGELGSPMNECDPAMPHPDIVFFSSARTAPRAQGGYDLWLAARSIGPSFDPPEPLVEVSTPDTDRDPWVTPDLRTIWFSSDRAGTEDLYVSSR